MTFLLLWALWAIWCVWVHYSTESSINKSKFGWDIEYTEAVISKMRNLICIGAIPLFIYIIFFTK